MDGLPDGCVYMLIYVQLAPYRHIDIYVYMVSVCRYCCIYVYIDTIAGKNRDRLTRGEKSLSDKSLSDISSAKNH